jgi:hypothetical protein
VIQGSVVASHIFHVVAKLGLVIPVLRFSVLIILVIGGLTRAKLLITRGSSTPKRGKSTSDKQDTDVLAPHANDNGNLPTGEFQRPSPAQTDRFRTGFNVVFCPLAVGTPNRANPCLNVGQKSGATNRRASLLCVNADWISLNHSEPGAICWSDQPMIETATQLRLEVRIEIVAPSRVLMAVTDQNLVSRHAFVSRIGFVPSLGSLRSIPNPFHILEQNLLTAAVIEFCGPAIGMAGDALCSFKGAVIFQKIRDAGRPK